MATQSERQRAYRQRLKAKLARAGQVEQLLGEAGKEGSPLARAARYEAALTAILDRLRGHDNPVAADVRRIAQRALS